MNRKVYAALLCSRGAFAPASLWGGPKGTQGSRNGLYYGNRSSKGVALVNLGRACAALGQIEQAIEAYESAIIILEEIESPIVELIRRWLANLVD